MSDTDNQTFEKFLHKGGECGEILRSIDWSNHPLGEPSYWPQSLKSSVSIILRSGYPMFLWWGEDLLINIHNDAYIALMGNKHPHFMAKPAYELWSEIWEEHLLPMKDLVFKKGEHVYREDLMLILERNGYREENYFNFSYSPIIDESGKVGGLFCACHEETDRVIEQRRLKNLTTLGGKLMTAHSLSQIAKNTIGKLSENPKDVPFAAFYLVKNDMAERAGHFGIDDTEIEQVFPRIIDIATAKCPIGTALNKGEAIVCDDISGMISKTEDFPFPRIPDQIYVQPVSDGKGNYVGVLLAGISPLRVFDESYKSYFKTVATKVSNAIRTVNTLLLEKERLKEIEESRERFKKLVLESPMGIVVFRGKDFVVEMANDSYLELIDRKREDFEGHSLFESVPELKGQPVEHLLNHVYDTGEAYYGNEFKAVLVRDGKPEECFFNFAYRPVTENGTIDGVMAVAVEVSRLVRAKHALQESESQFRNMVMQSPIPMTIFRGPEYIIEIANREMFEKIWRKTGDGVIGRPALEVFPELNDQKYPELLRAVLHSGVAHREKESVAYIQGDDGMRKFYLDFEYAPLKETDGSVSGILITVNDVTEKVEVRELLRESESYFRRMADSVPVMIWITDRDGYCTYVNKQWSEYSGQKFEDSLRHGWLSAIHPDDREYSFTVFQESTKNSEKFTIEYRLKNLEGKYKWALVEALPRFDVDNQFEGYIGTVTDIDDRKTFEEKIKESEERFRLAITTAELGTYEWIVDTNEVIISERFAQIFCVDGPGLSDRNLLISRIHADDREIHRKAHENAVKTSTLDYEVRIVWPDHSTHWIKIKGRIVEDRAKNMRKMLGTVMDITGIKRVSQALKTSEARLAEAQRIAGIGNWEYNYADKSFYCSEEVYRILSVTPEKFVPSFYNLFRIIHPNDIKKLSRTLTFTRKTGLPFNIDFQIVTEDDQIKYINSQGYVVLDENHRMVKIIGTLQDITARKLVEEQLIEAKKLSEKSLHYKERFLANMSHEIRTPMNAIVGFTELTLKTPLQPEQKQYIEAIKTSGENLLVIINDILDFSKLEAGAIHFERIDFKLSELISTLTDLMLPKSVEKGITLSVSIDAEIPDKLVGDPTRLNQILLNLVGNAIKFTEKGEIKIAARLLWNLEKELEIQFSVADTGIGIDPSMIEAIFEVFTQTSSETTRKYGGSGLGLAIVKQFVERQGGKIWVDSEPGKGSTFYFNLVFGKSDNKAGTENRQPETVIEYSLESIKVLLVEDNKLNQLLAIKALSDWNWQVEVADNGIVALEKITKNDYDVVLMDIQLPEMDGYEATRYIRNTFESPKRDIPIIAVTAHAMQSEIKKCRDAGMDGYITKPFSPKMLYEGIVQVMESKVFIRKIET